PIGAEAPVNGAVVVHVGNGPREITVPDVTGQTEDAARTVLEQVNLKVVSVAGDSELPAGQVVSSSPSAGTTVEQGSTVQIVVSRGNMFVMPNLRGQTPAQARQSLAAAGWEDTTLTRSTRNVPITSSDDGKVVGQEPDAGARVRKNGSVSIVVGQGSLLPG
ncbi:PASTA domain-containing protein, partial [Streptomyces sp. SID10244]|nr:PASTA domain-containing protein [Streptomyces sp. SID10244]